MEDDIEAQFKEFYKLYKACEVISNWIRDKIGNQ